MACASIVGGASGLGDQSKLVHRGELKLVAFLKASLSCDDATYNRDARPHHAVVSGPSQEGRDFRRRVRLDQVDFLIDSCGRI